MCTGVSGALGVGKADGASRRQPRVCWENNKESHRDCLSSWFLVIDPFGNEIKTNRLQEFCLTKKLPYTTIWKSSTTNATIKKGKAKGWSCRKI